MLAHPMMTPVDQSPPSSPVPSRLTSYPTPLTVIPTSSNNKNEKQETRSQEGKTEGKKQEMQNRQAKEKRKEKKTPS